MGAQPNKKWAEAVLHRGKTTQSTKASRSLVAKAVWATKGKKKIWSNEWLFSAINCSIETLATRKRLTSTSTQFRNLLQKPFERYTKNWERESERETAHSSYQRTAADKKPTLQADHCQLSCFKRETKIVAIQAKAERRGSVRNRLGSNKRNKRCAWSTKTCRWA